VLDEVHVVGEIAERSASWTCEAPLRRRVVVPWASKVFLGMTSPVDHGRSDLYTL